jgi:fructosamine-3-kinase
MNRKLASRISAIISDATRRRFELLRATPVGGGSINESFRIEGDGETRYFLKLNDARHHAMFAAETAGLDAIAATATIRVPQAIALGIIDEQSYLVLEHLDLTAHGDARQLGEKLAALHRCTVERFGFAQDNFIGTTAQPNGWADDWIVFWRERRLQYQLRLAAKNGYGGRLQELGEKLVDILPALFAGHRPQPSLLHGDLWGGNHAFLGDGTPVIFDPAAYYGDREADLAMTELFGGYPEAFYAAYRAAWPPAEGYERRRELYNLYHVLNHANLFGAGYARQAEQMMQAMLARYG